MGVHQKIKALSRQQYILHGHIFYIHSLNCKSVKLKLLGFYLLLCTYILVSTMDIDIEELYSILFVGRHCKSLPKDSQTFIEG